MVDLKFGKLLISKLFFSSLLYVVAVGLPAVAEQDYVFANLSSQLDHLANVYEVDIRGIELTVSKPSESISGAVEFQVRSLLQSFNYVTIHNADGKLERIIIIGEKQDRPRETIVQTEWQGSNYVVDVTLTGQFGTSLETSLVVDTGADYVVLPDTMMELLRMNDVATEVKGLQTANGIADAKIGRLAELRIANEVITDVDVAFIDDELLGGAKLLGMSVLNQFKVTLDSQQQTITLIRTE